MIRRVLAISAVVLVVTTVVGWAGFQVGAPVVEPEHGTSRLGETTVLPDGLPPALQFYLQQTVGRTPPVTTRAVLWGTGRARFEIGPVAVWLPVSWSEAVDVERGYVWRGHVTWWRRPILDIEERFSRVGGGDTLTTAHARCEAAARAMRAQAERIWLPSSLIRTSDATWHRRGSWRLSVLYDSPDGSPDSLSMEFDQRTRALTQITGTRCATDSTAAEWSVAFTRWDTPGGFAVPVEGTASLDGHAYYEFTLAGAAYNTSVEHWFEGVR